MEIHPDKPFSPACERNREPILAALRPHFADRRRVLEIGSGTGQHAVHFAAALPRLVWQTSDRAPWLAGISQWLAEAALPAELRVACLQSLAHASGAAGMCGGQALDLEAEGRQVNLEQLERIHRHKTGALIRSAVRLGALSAGEQGRKALPVLDRYAESIGLAFQVQDDILDVVGDTATLGKRQGADQQLGKSTYPALLGLEQAQRKARDLIDDARQSLNELAAQSLDTSALEALADYIIQRDK